MAWWRWDSRPMQAWVMLNPSVPPPLTGEYVNVAFERRAAKIDGATLKKCIGYAKRDEYGGVILFNLYSYRSVNPDDLYDTSAYNENNDWFLQYCFWEYRNRTIFGWGSHPLARFAYTQFMIKMEHDKWMEHCLGKNVDSSPKHPLYLPKDQPLIPWHKYESQTDFDDSTDQDG